MADDAIRGVTEWAATQDPNEERALSVKMSPRTAEVIASIPVDEEIAVAAVAKHQVAVVTDRCKRHARVSGCQNAVIDPL